MLEFGWDSNKAQSNFRKHGISFEEATTVFSDSLSLTISDPEHSSQDEERFITIGMSYLHRLLVVSHCDRGEAIRIISVRKAERREKKYYEDI